MWVLATLLSYVLNIWLNASLGNTARILRAGDRPPRGPSALRTWPRWLRAARVSENRLRCSFRRRCGQTRPIGGKAEDLLCFGLFCFLMQLRGLHNAFGAPPAPPPLAAPPSAGSAGERAEGLSFLLSLLPVPCRSLGWKLERALNIYISNICNGVSNNQPSPGWGDLQGPPKHRPRDGGGCVTPLCWKQTEGGLMLFLLLCSPLLCRKDP